MSPPPATHSTPALPLISLPTALLLFLSLNAVTYLLWRNGFDFRGHWQQKALVLGLWNAVMWDKKTSRKVK
jgi:hypothetical protein